MVILKVAVATKGSKGLKDEVSYEFGRAPTFTVINLEDSKVKNVEVVENPAVSYEYGSGPIVVKMLSDMKVEAVVGGEFGPGVSVFLKDKNIRAIKVTAGTKISQALDNVIK